MQFTGRTMTDHIVVFDGAERLIGRTVEVHIDDASAFTLFGRVITTGFANEPVAVRLSDADESAGVPRAAGLRPAARKEADRPAIGLMRARLRPAANVLYPPASAPTIQNASRPSATAAGSGASGDSFE